MRCYHIKGKVAAMAQDLKNQLHGHTMERLEAAKQVTENGVEYWMARELGPILGYQTWGKFEHVVARAQAALSANGKNASHQIVQTGKSVGREDSRDYFLTRGASYLIAINGDPTKPEVAAAQIYFASKTRQMELEEQAAEDVKRLELREKVSHAHRRVSAVAEAAGVRGRMQGVFHDAGARGLYGLSTADVKRRKGLKDGDNLFDNAGALELSANEFQKNLAADVISREGIKSEQSAIGRNKQVGAEVRAAMTKSGARMPEDLPLEPEPISVLKKRIKARDKARLSNSSTS
jgi:DNA-damage-inducible protein D